MTKFVALFFSLFIFTYVLNLIRKEKLTFKYAFYWLTVSGLASFFVVFDDLLYRISDFFGFLLPSNFIFFTILSFFVFLTLLLTIFLCDQNSRNDIMAQKMALLEHEIGQLRKQIQQQEEGTYERN